MWPSVSKRSNSPPDITCIVPPSNLLIVVDENKPLISQAIILFDVDVPGDTHSSRPQLLLPAEYPGNMVTACFRYVRRFLCLCRMGSLSSGDVDTGIPSRFLILHKPIVDSHADMPHAVTPGPKLHSYTQQVVSQHVPCALLRYFRSRGVLLCMYVVVVTLNPMFRPCNREKQKYSVARSRELQVCRDPCCSLWLASTRLGCSSCFLSITAPGLLAHIP